MTPPDPFSIRDMQERKRRMGHAAPLAPPTVPDRTPRQPVPVPAPVHAPAAAPVSAPAEPEDRIDLLVYWESLVRQRKWILTALIVGTGLGALFSLNRVPSYRAAGKFTLNRNLPDLHVMDREDAMYYGDSFWRDAQEITTRGILSRAAQRLSGEVRELAPSATEAELAEAQSADWRRVQGALVVTPLEDERVVTVEASAGTAILAAAYVNAAMEAYQEADLESQKERARTLHDVLGRAIESKRAEVDEIDRQIIEEQGRIARMGGNQDPLNSEEQSRLRIMEDYILKRGELEIELKGLETQIVRWREVVAEESASEGPAESVLGAEDSFAKRLRELQIERGRLLVKYTADHPKVLDIETEIEQLTKLRQEAIADSTSRSDESQHLRNLRLQLLSAEMRKVDLEKKIESYDLAIAERGRVMNEVNSARLPVEILRSQKTVMNQVISDFVERQTRASIEMNVGDSKVNIIEPAIAPLGPVQSSRTQPLLLWIAGSIALGVGLAIFIDSLSRTIKGPTSARKELGLRTIGLLPALTSKERDRYIDPTLPTSLLAEAFGVLRNNIRFGQNGNHEKLLLVTSPLPGEGKSFTSANLAISFALEGNRVVLIDGDLRRSRPDDFYQAVGVVRPETQRGLSDLLTHSELALSDVLVQTGITDLCWIPSGTRPANPAQALRSPKLGELFVQVQRYFDVAVVDSPALVPIADSAQIASHAQGVVLVLANEQTPIAAALQASERLRHVGGRILGVILNKTHRYASGHYYGYAKYGYPYGEEE